MALQAIINQTRKPDKLVIFDGDPLYKQLFYMLQAKEIAWEWLYAGQ